MLRTVRVRILRCVCYWQRTKSGFANCNSSLGWVATNVSREFRFRLTLTRIFDVLDSLMSFRACKRLQKLMGAASQKDNTSLFSAGQRLKNRDLAVAFETWYHVTSEGLWKEVSASKRKRAVVQHKMRILVDMAGARCACDKHTDCTLYLYGLCICCMFDLGLHGITVLS